MRFYVPKEHIKYCLVSGGKKIKKKPYGNFKDIVKATFFVEPDKIYLNKKKPDFISVTYPSRKADGARVKSVKPAFKPGLTISFTLTVITDEIDLTTTKLILEKGGLEAGIGAWRPEHGRFEVTEFKKK